MGNFVKIDRKILEWEWWDDFNTFRLFTCLFLHIGRMGTTKEN